MSAERTNGVVKRFSDDRGYGFIGVRGGRDVFVSAREVKNAGLATLYEGQHVSFTTRETDKGLHAENLTLLDSPSPGKVSQPSHPKEENWSRGENKRPSSQTSFTFGPDYLAEGYFEQKEGKDYLRPQVLDSLAVDAAKALGNREMKSHQLRRFFNKARGIEAKLDRVKDFEAIKADIYGFKRDVAYQVGRKVVPEEFRLFIERNVELAVQDEKSFRQGFLQHFESVLAYFVYYFRD